MSGIIYSLLGFVLAIGILVTVHEYGHFWVARKLGVRVLKFSIGFGKTLWRWRRANDSTEYVIGLIPLGGYVQMLDEREAAVAVAERDYAFNRQPLGVRSAIVVAGPAANFIFAIFAVWLIFIIGSEDIEAVVGHVEPDSLAEQAGFRPGDVITVIDGKTVKSWGHQQLYLLHQAMKANVVDMSVTDAAQTRRDLSVDFAELAQSTITGRAITTQIGIAPPEPPAVVTELVEDYPAARAGLLVGDVIVAINGELVTGWRDMATRVRSSPGESLQLQVQRQALELTIDVVPNTIHQDGQTFGQLGLFPPSPTTMQLRFGPVDALWQAIDYNWRMAAITMRALGRMVMAEMSPENISGPITIARLAGRTLQSSVTDFLKFLAIISISLGLINLLPIPVLDGGHLMYFAVEAVTGKQPTMNVLLWGQRIGLVMIVLLMTLAFYNDFMSL